MRDIEARVLIVAGSLLAAAGFWWQSGLGLDDGYVVGILGPAIVMSVGVGLLNTPLTGAGTSGVTEADAGAASVLMNTTKQGRGALGLAALVAATTLGTPGGFPGGATWLAAGHGVAFVAMAAVMVAVALIALAVPSTRQAQPVRSQRQP